MSERDPIFGDLRFLADMRANQVKGNFVAGRAWYVEKMYGKPALAELVRKVDGQARAWLTAPPLAFSWCDYGPLLEIDRAIVEGPMGGNVAATQHFGAEIAKHDLPLTYRILFKIGTPGFVLRNARRAWSTYVKEGVVDGESDGKRGLVRLRGKVVPLYFCRYGVAGWLAASVELSGGQAVTVEHVECRHDGADSCAWSLGWR